MSISPADNIPNHKSPQKKNIPNHKTDDSNLKNQNQLVIA
jgi:hypothetical protein